MLLVFQFFAKIEPKSSVRINSDYSSVVAWVINGISKKMGFVIISAIEVFKFQHGFKVKAFYI